MQPFVWPLYKAEPVNCSYATRTGENVVIMPNKRCMMASLEQNSTAKHQHDLNTLLETLKNPQSATLHYRNFRRNNVLSTHKNTE
ncbi:hypothetical protein SAMN05216262_10842 [Colwellia chukchiensis]|uniref:Uncharacterized protein n=1 Tax=Colwellia chukchiensis TaxID=641665 RepID=A0A1H7NPK8_9GAMM|nr:hypothetical protein SAMN05216262_10842 [Colwellia chukchiensis]